MMQGLGAVACAYLVLPWSGRPVEQYQIAGVLLAIGVVLWAATYFTGGRNKKKFDDAAIPGKK